MIEAYAFLAMFAVQIVAVSVVYPAWFIRYVRAQAKTIPAERFAQLYPGVDLGHATERFVIRYRTLSASIAVLGLLLLGWLFSYLRRPDWDDGPVEILTVVYFMVQMLLPLSLAIWLAVKFHEGQKRSLAESKRKAVLQRRGLFDFVSPFAVFLAVLSYFLFVAFVIYLREHPFPGFAGFINIGVVTLIYVLQGVVVYAMLYGKKSNPFETHAGHLRTIGLVVKSCVYSCIACVVYLSLSFTLAMMDSQRWEPFALSVFFVVSGLLSLTGITSPPRLPGPDGLALPEHTHDGRGSPP